MSSNDSQFITSSHALDQQVEDLIYTGKKLKFYTGGFIFLLRQVKRQLFFMCTSCPAQSFPIKLGSFVNMV